MAQIFVESIFEKHVDWVKLIQDDDNYKNILQVKIQKKFQDTPHYIEINHDDETGYEMGVYLCLGQKIHQVNREDADCFTTFGSFDNIQAQMETEGKVFVFLGKGIHKIKRKAEQMACEETLKLLE
jgi:dsRNA-specific ribonuclease